VRIDAHQHYWKIERGDYGWITPEYPVLYRDFLPADLSPHLKAHQLDGTILVQAAPTIAETEFILVPGRYGRHDPRRGRVAGPVRPGPSRALRAVPTPSEVCRLPHHDSGHAGRKPDSRARVRRGAPRLCGRRHDRRSAREEQPAGTAGQAAGAGSPSARCYRSHRETPHPGPERSNRGSPICGFSPAIRICTASCPAW